LFEAVYALFIADLASERECARLDLLPIAYFAVPYLFIKRHGALRSRNSFLAARAEDTQIVALRYFLNHCEPHSEN